MKERQYHSGRLRSRRLLNAIAWWRRTTASETRRRAAPRRRRSWLRDLDLVLCKELGDAGTLSCQELFEMAHTPLDGRASMATIAEWWEYTYRRGWLEEHGAGRCRLTQIADDGLRAAQRRESGPNYMTGARALMRWVAAAGLISTTAALTQKDLSIYISAVMWVVSIAGGLAILALLIRWTEPWMDRSNARSSCDLLEGRRMRFLFLLAPPIDGEPRRVYLDAELCAPGHAAPSEDAQPEGSTATFAVR